MNSNQLLCADTGCLMVKTVLVPETFLERAKGLLGARGDDHPGMVFRRCSMIHMFGMRRPLDVIFLDDNETVIKVIDVLKPWKIGGCWRSAHTLELPAGLASRLGIIKGRRLKIC